jgi:hypothetical protein
MHTMHTTKTLQVVPPHAPDAVPALTPARWPLAAVLVAAALLSACGGGGGSSPESTPEPTPVPTPESPATPSSLSAAQLQGRWLTSTGVTPARTAIVLPGAEGSTEVWLLASDLSSVSRLQLSTRGIDGVSASGKSYSLPSSASNVGQSVSDSGTANLSNNSLSLNSGALLLTRSDALTTASSLADVVGNWSASVGGQTATLRLAVAANGALSGSGSTGCSYSGSLSARSDATAYDAGLSEVCSSGTTAFAGIATYRAGQGSTPAALTLAMTTTDAAQTQALVLGMRQP